MDNDWAYNEIIGAKLWDARCHRNLARACQRLAENAGVSFSRALGSVRKSVSRILHHDKTTPEDLLGGHVRATARRLHKLARVLVASDTTFFNFTSHAAVEGLGPIGDSATAKGFLLHSALAMAEDGTPLGLLYQKSWARDKAQAGQAKNRRKRPAGDKESAKWTKTQQALEKALPNDMPVLLIQDREADVFAFMAAPRRAGLELLVRMAHPQRVVLAGEHAKTHLQAALLGAPIEARLSVLVGARPGQPEREAVLDLRRVLVGVCPPRNDPAPKPAPIFVWAVAATEASPPEGVAGIGWFLLSTLPVPDSQTAAYLVGAYAKRSRIEQFHYVLKSGLGFERLQVDTLAGLQKALSVLSIVAWRLLYLLYLARHSPQAPAEEAVSFAERRVLEQVEGKPVETVAQVVLAVARLAGFRPMPSAATPGVKSLWLGWRKLADVLFGYQLATSRPAP